MHLFPNAASSARKKCIRAASSYHYLLKLGDCQVENPMTTAPLGRVVEHIRRVAGKAGAAEISDGHLLERFLCRQDAGAFEVLLQRHAGLVLGVCERVLRHRQDAEDAFQATFMVLVNRGSSIMGHRNIAGWLYGVAFRTSLYARRRTARRRSVEDQCSTPLVGTDTSVDVIRRDLRLVLDEELSRLPAKYRDPLVLCYLEGRTNEQAARILGWTKGTVSGRLARARDLLRDRLTRRGLTLSGGALALGLSQSAGTAPASTLIHAAVKSGVSVAAGTFVASAPIASLTEGVLLTLALSNLKLTSAVVGALGLVLAGAGYGGYAMFNLPVKVAATVAQKVDLPKDDQERILGKWAIIDGERDGRRETKYVDPLGEKFQMEFTKDELHFEDGPKRAQMKYRLLPNKSPKLIEFQTPGEIRKGLGLYAFEGETLKLCLNSLNGEAPKEFKAELGSGFAVFVLRRAQPSDKTDLTGSPQRNEAMIGATSANNLRQIMAALLNYHAANGRFPGMAITSTDGTPLLSWRVAILPYLEQQNLYKMFHLNEPWDSKHNKPLASIMPKFYVPPGDGPKCRGKTFYRSFVGPDAFFSGKGGRKAPEGFPDGMSQTLAIFEAGEGVIWTAPDEIPYAAGKPLPKFGNSIASGFYVVTGDDSIRLVPHTTDERTIRAMITTNGGEVFEMPQSVAPGAQSPKGPSKEPKVGN